MRLTCTLVITSTTYSRVFRYPGLTPLGSPMLVNDTVNFVFLVRLPSYPLFIFFTFSFSTSPARPNIIRLLTIAPVCLDLTPSSYCIYSSPYLVVKPTGLLGSLIVYRCYRPLRSVILQFSTDGLVIILAAYLLAREDGRLSTLSTLIKTRLVS